MDRKSKFKVLFMCVALILALVILYSGLRILESTVFYKQQDGAATTSKVIERGNAKYYPRTDIVVVLVMGIGQEGIVEETAPNQAYPADMITLMIFDEQSKDCKLLCLNRDTMLKMPILNEYGRQTGIYYGQLALSHTYGTGLEDSCENTKKAVSDLLYGITIDYYYAMNLDAIALLTDAVGGVTVTIEDDFSLVDPALQMGEMTLTGEQALTFVQSRKNVGTQLNLSRMERQKEFMRGFMDALQTNLDESDTQALEIYDSVSPYVVTDCSWKVISRLLENYGDYSLNGVYSLPGENVKGEKYYEYHTDYDQLDALILELFYKQIN